MKKIPRVLILGRANVGKSTLFNRLLEKPKALTSSIPGTTRDINIGNIYWQGINFELVDTGGIETILPAEKLKQMSPIANADFAGEIIKQTQAAIKHADLILFVVDNQAGLMPQDRELSKQIKKSRKKIILAANKTDNFKMQNRAAEFYKLGLGEPILVSAINGQGTGDLLDIMVENVKKITKSRKGPKLEMPSAIKVTFIGKPNVGKSSLLNAILGEERVIVSPIPFTTRESVDTLFEHNKQKFILVDTAGVRKQPKISQGLEKMSVRKSLTNAKNADICFLLVDISQPITVQDNKLSKILLDANVSIIIVANKWDLIPEKETKTQKKYIDYIYRMFPYLTWAPIIFLSAKTGKNVHRVLDLASQIFKARQTEISDSALNKFLKQAIKKHKPAQAMGGRHPYVYSLEQIKTNPPTFYIKIRQTDTLSPSYLKYLENSLREHFNLSGTPIRISLKK